MKTIEIRTIINELSDHSQLSASDKVLVEKATHTAREAYAPYSGFKVGAALTLEDQTIITGNNQENAAYPSGLCAERVALFSASAMHPKTRISSLAIAALKDQKKVSNPIYPCGSCRQVMIEIEDRQAAPIRLILVGESRVHILENCRQLLPMGFDKKSLNG
jgi:cytidine deaminase